MKNKETLKQSKGLAILNLFGFISQTAIAVNAYYEGNRGWVVWFFSFIGIICLIRFIEILNFKIEFRDSSLEINFGFKTKNYNKNEIIDFEITPRKNILLNLKNGSQIYIPDLGKRDNTYSRLNQWIKNKA